MEQLNLRFRLSKHVIMFWRDIIMLILSGRWKSNSFCVLYIPLSGGGAKKLIFVYTFE